MVDIINEEDTSILEVIHIRGDTWNHVFETITCALAGALVDDRFAICDGFNGVMTECFRLPVAPWNDECANHFIF
jgi:hypothetical protein